MADSAWTVALFKGLAVVIPFLLGGWPLRWNRLRVGRIGAYICAALLIILLLTPISLRGVGSDYLLYMLTGTLLMSFWIGNGVDVKLRWRRSILIGLLVLAVYVPVKAMFGSIEYTANSRDGLFYRTYKIPDMVAAPTFRMEISLPWFIFERRLFQGQVVLYCNEFTWDRHNGKLVVTDTCGTRLP